MASRRVTDMKGGDSMRKKWIVFGALAAGAAALASAARPNLPGLIFNAIFSERVYRQRSFAYGPLPRQNLDLFEPAPAQQRRGVAIFFYGGGWRTGDRALYRFVGASLAARGFATVIPDYRLFPEARFPAFMEDAGQAYRWVAKNIADNQPIIVLGHSAGGHIAALLALDPKIRGDAPAPDGLIGLAAPYAFDPTTWPTTAEIFSPTAGHPDAARPVAFVRPQAPPSMTKAPPSLLLRGAEDETVAAYNAEDFAQALKSADVPVENKQYAGIGHIGLILTFAWPFRWRAPALADSIAFIERITAPR